MAEERFWNTNNSHFTDKPVTMTMAQAGRIFRLDPEPPKVDDINKYIIAAVRTRRGIFFTYFLHHYEPRLNKRVYRFLLNEGMDRYDPERFLDYKLTCILAMIECLFQYDLNKGADYLTYAHRFIGNALLECRRQEEAGSFRSLDEYKATRGIAWLYNNSEKSTQEVVAEYAGQQNCTEETAAEYLTVARQNRSRVPFYVTIQDEDSEETGEDVTCEYRAIHRYANEDNCSGTIQFDLQNRTSKILTLADGDICNTNVFARTAIRYIWGLDGQELPKSSGIHVRL